jgi:hypothetical protein
VVEFLRKSAASYALVDEMSLVLEKAAVDLEEVYKSGAKQNYQ